jgi:multisubunit Na+/H+ antiporter MnhF subunit
VRLTYRTNDPPYSRSSRRRNTYRAYLERLTVKRRALTRQALRQALRYLRVHRVRYAATIGARRERIVVAYGRILYPGCNAPGIAEARLYRRLDYQRAWCRCLRCACRSCNPVLPWTGNRANACGACECTTCYPTPRRCNRCACQRCYPPGHRRNCNRCTCLFCYAEGRCGSPDCDRCNPRVPSRVQGHDYRPFPQFHSYRGGAEKVQGAPHPGERYFGIEVECERRSDRARRQDEIAAWCAANEGLRYYCKYDGSLSDGVEVVSHPASFAAWCARGPELTFAKYMRDNGYSSYSTTTCGFHCHVSRTALPPAALARLLLFVSTHARAVKRWSRRRGETLDRWARIDVESAGAIVRKVTENDHPDRYVAINCRNAATIEFRIFRGTLISSSILRNIGLVEALVSFARTTNSKQLQMADFLRHVAREARAKDRTAAERSVLSSVLDWVGPLSEANATNEQATLPVES